MADQDTILLVAGLMLVAGLIVEDLIRRHKKKDDD